MIKTYYHLTKPGIVRGNLITAAAGYLFVTGFELSIWNFIAVMIGVAMVIGCGCVLNNIIDINIDKKMKRTRNRALVTGTVSKEQAYVFATILGVVGTIILAYSANLLTAFIGVIGLIFYVLVYGYAKRNTVHSTLIGSLSGAVPPLAGYVAASGYIDLAAIIIFITMILWQMPHFYAIAIYREHEYAAANLPVLSIIRGVRYTTYSIIGYSVAFSLCALSLSIFGYSGYIYALSMLIVGSWWIIYCLKGLGTKNKIKWAKGVFGVSLIVLLTWSTMLAFSMVLP